MEKRSALFMDLEMLRYNLYRDPADKRLVVLGIDEVQNIACIGKVIDQNHCLNEEVSTDPIYMSTADDPLRFARKTSKHSCEGIYWHIHIPLTADGKRIYKQFAVKPESIDGMVQDPEHFEGIWLADDVKKAVENTYELDGQRAEEYILHNREAICPELLSWEMETPFTTVYRDKLSGKVTHKKHKKCGYVHGDDVAMELEIVQQQFQDKVKDIKRLYSELLKIDFRVVVAYEKMVDNVERLALRKY